MARCVGGQLSPDLMVIFQRLDDALAKSQVLVGELVAGRGSAAAAATRPTGDGLSGELPADLGLVAICQRADDALTVGQKLVNELADARGVIVAKLCELGFTYKQLAPLLGISAARIGQIVKVARLRNAGGEGSARQ